ncbi:MAG: sugar phosphate nucleotidyltransferase [Acidobacteriota bacterium]
MKAVVMAGGEGTRLRPLTCNLPKPMVPVLSKPVMEYSIHLLKKYGITDIAATLQYLPNVISGYFGNGEEWNVNMRYFLEESPLGTAGSVKNAGEFLDETFIVISGDALTDFPLDQAIEFHRSKKALATLVLTRVESPLEYGLVLTDKEGQINRFLEKPSWGEVFSDTVNTGIYILEPEALEDVPKDRPFDFSRDLFPKFLARKDPMFAVVLDGYWCDIGNCQQYRQVHIDILNNMVKIPIQGERRGSIIRGHGSQISPRARVEGPVYIGPNCDVEPGAHLLAYTVLAGNSIVGPGTSLKRSIVWGGTCIGRNSEIRGAILGKGVRVHDRCSVFEGAVLGDNSVLEDDVVVQPEIKVWPYKVVESKRVVTESLVWSDRLPRSIFTQQGISGDYHSQLPPEKMAKLGRTMGTHLHLGAKVVIGCDGSAVSLAAKEALLAGLISTGLQVYEAGQVLLPILRFAVRETESAMGFHLALAGTQFQNVSLRIVGQQGLDLLKTDERKIENAFYRGEYRAVNIDKMHMPERIADLDSAYISDILEDIDQLAINTRRFRIVLGAELPGISNIAARILDRLGCDIVRVDGFEVSVNGIYDREEVLNNVSQTTVRHGAEIGVFLEDGGQKVVFTASDGTVIEDEKFTALISGTLGTCFGKVFLPVYVPVSIEDYLRRQGRKVVRTRAFFGEFMQEMIREGEAEQLRLYADGLFATLKLLEFMARHDYSFVDLLENMPSFNYIKREVPVSWEDKGRVIRRLAEENVQYGSEQSLGGIRMNHDNGIGLILPDEDRPVCRIYAEAFSMEMAESLADFYHQKIENICQELS